MCQGARAEMGADAGRAAGLERGRDSGRERGRERAAERASERARALRRQAASWRSAATQQCAFFASPPPHSALHAHPNS